MKIGLVCPYNLFRGGGVQECVFALQEELMRRGHIAKIITPLPRGKVGIVPENVQFIGRATQLKTFHTTPDISVSANAEEIDTMLQDEQFDVLHFHEPWVPIVSRQILSRSTSVNIATFHAKLPETMMSRTIERVITPYTKSIMKYLHGLTAVSEAAAEYVSTLTRKPVQLIPNGIDLKKYHQPATKHQKTESTPKTILYVGRLEKRKGLICLLDAYSLLRQEHPGVRLVIAGEGVERKKLEAYVEDNNIKGVRFNGYVSSTQKPSLFQSSDLFCSPALYGESFGIVLLEAMASGLVTVAGNNPGYSGVLQDRGSLSLVNPKDTPEFANRLALLLYDENIRSLWREWAKTYVRQFDYARIVDQYEALYTRSRRT